MDLGGSSGSDETIDGVGSVARRRFSSSAQPPNGFLTPNFSSAVALGGSNSRIPIYIEPSLSHFPQSRLGRLHFSSSSSSSNESPDSNSTSTVAARKRMQQLVNLRSFSSLSQRGSTQSLLSPATNLQSLPLSARSSSSYSVYKNPLNVKLEEDVLVMDALGESVPITFRARKPLEPLSSSSSSSSANSSHSGANFFKTEICRSWDEFGLCRFGTRCQFAHGKEELRCAHDRYKLKHESGKLLSTVGLGSKYTKYPRNVPILLVDSTLPSSESPSSSSTTKGIPMKTYTENLKIIAPVAQQSDSTFSWPPTEDVEAEIQLALYSPTQRHNRLPVFQDICSDSILNILTSSKELVDLLRNVDMAYHSKLSGLYSSFSSLDKYISSIRQQLKDWEHGLCESDADGSFLHDNWNQNLKLFNDGEDGALKLLQLFVLRAEHEIQAMSGDSTRSLKSLDSIKLKMNILFDCTIAPSSHSPNSAREAQSLRPGREVFTPKNNPGFGTGAWSDVKYKGDWMHRPVSDTEVAWLARLLIRVSERLNEALGLDPVCRSELCRQPIYVELAHDNWSIEGGPKEVSLMLLNLVASWLALFGQSVASFMRGQGMRINLRVFSSKKFFMFSVIFAALYALKKACSEATRNYF